jgi:endonuclease/exonuclease/phosphatase (EEP) superfamily protein YafD
MSGELKTIQWNIGGGRILADGQDPTLMSSYSEDGMQHIIDLIAEHEPDLVTLQETHPSQPSDIASALDYEHWVNHEVSASHIDETQRLGHGFLSRLPVKHVSFRAFETPDWKNEDKDGAVTDPHEKGLSTYEVRLRNRELLVAQNLHLFPFSHFGIDPTSTEANPVLREVERKVGRFVGKRLVQGDFNLDSPSLRRLLPGLFEAGLDEIVLEEGTTPKGKHIDHILFAGVTVVESVVIKSALTDHFPIVSTFAL